MAREMDLDALASTNFHAKPSPWSTYENVFYAPVLEAAFPTDHFEYHLERKLLDALGKKRTEAWYQHNVKTRPLLELGKTEPYEADQLGDHWIAVAEDLVSPEYRDCISEVTGHDVRRLQLQAHFWQFGEGSFFRPHVDKPHKIVTHLMYLTDHWTPQMGGCFQILGSDEPGDIRAEIPPLKNTGVLLKRTDRSWHAVSRIPIGYTEPRKVLQVWFWQGRIGSKPSQ